MRKCKREENLKTTFTMAKFFYYKHLSSLTQHDGRVLKMQSPLKNLTFNTIILEIKFQYESLHSTGAIQSHLNRGYTNLQEDMENIMYEKEGLIQQCVYLHKKLLSLKPDRI